MALGGYLPPLVTDLEANVKPLAEGFAEGEALADAYSSKIDNTLSEGGRTAGRDMAKGLTSEMKMGLDGVYRDAHGRLRDERGRFVKDGEALGAALGRGIDDALGGGGRGGGSSQAGRRAGQSFFSQFMEGAQAIGANFVPILIGAAILAAPAIAAAISTAIAIALPLVFAGAGVAIAAAMLPGVQKAFKSLADPIRSAFKYAITGGFDDALIGAIGEFRKYIPAFRTELRGVFDAVAPILKPLADALGKSLVVFLASLKDALVNSQPVILSFLSQLPALVQSIGEFFVEVTKDGPALVRFLGDSLNFLEKFITDSGKVIAWLSGVYAWVVKLNDESPIEFLGFTRSLEGLKIGWTKFTSWLSGAWSATKAWVSSAVSSVGDWFAQLPGRVWNVIKAIPGFFVRIWHDVLYGVGYFIGSWVGELMALPGQLVSVVKALWNAGVEQFKLAFGAFVALAKWGVSKIISWFTGLPHRAMEGFHQLKADVINFFKNAPSWLEQAGQDIVLGLIHGLEHAGGWAIDKVKGLAGDLLHGFKDALHISSPSGAFADESAWIPAGVAQGIDRAASTAYGAVRRMADGAVAVWSGSMGSMRAQPVYAGAGGGPGGYAPPVVETTVMVDGAQLVRALTPSTQRRKNRSGTSGMS